MTKIELLRKYLELQQYANEWLETVPHEVRIAFFDNPYCNALGNCSDHLLSYTFSERILYDVQWYLYDRGGDNSIEVDGKVYFIHSIDDFLSFIKEQHEEFEEQPNGAARTFRGR